MATPRTPDEERRQHQEYCRLYSERRYQERLAGLFAWWQEFNREFFGGVLEPPHINLGRTAPRSQVHVSAETGYGGRLQITLNERLAFGDNPAWVNRAWPPAPGTGRFIRDLLLRGTTRQYVFEVEGTPEPGYRGYGPAFAAHANRIGLALGLPPVVASRRRPGDEAQPLARGWPHCVRGREYYGDDITEALYELAVGGSGRRDVAASPGLGIYEFFLYLLNTGRAPRLQQILARQVDWLARLRERRLPTRLRVEDGRLDVDGKTPLSRVDFEPAWCAWNNGCVGKMAQALLAFQSFADLPVLADALEEAGCYDPRILRHLRTPQEHSSRCWVLRGLLGVYAQGRAGERISGDEEEGPEAWPPIANA